MTMSSNADSASWQQRRWCLRKDLTTERFHKRVCLQSNCQCQAILGYALNLPSSYFPTVYEPTVFENYVHGTFTLRN